MAARSLRTYLIPGIANQEIVATILVDIYATRDGFSKPTVIRRGRNAKIVPFSDAN